MLRIYVKILQMSASSIARTNNSIVKRCTGVMAEAGINWFVINHITKKIEIGPVKTANDMNYMSQNETTPGGTSVNYLADTFGQLKPGKKLEPEKDFGIKGFIVNFKVLKSRSNESGRTFELVFSQADGFDNFYTNFNFLKNEKYLKGAGKGYYFDFDPDTKFMQKNAKKVYLENEEWAKQFDELVQQCYYEFITTKGFYEEDEENLDDNDSYDEEEEIELIEVVGKVGKKKVYSASDGNYYFSNGELCEDFDDSE